MNLYKFLQGSKKRISCMQNHLSFFSTLKLRSSSPARTIQGLKLTKVSSFSPHIIGSVRVRVLKEERERTDELWRRK